jgi:hypothetical protein
VTTELTLEILSDENSFTLSHHVIPSPSTTLRTGSAMNPYDAASYKNHHRDFSVQKASE